MAELIRIEHIENLADQTPVNCRVEIHDSEHSGAVDERLATGNFFEWDYDQPNEREPFSDPVQRAIFTVDIMTDTPARRESDRQLLESILENPGRYTIEFYVDNDLQWRGVVMADQVEYSEAMLHESFKIRAYDIRPLEDKEFPLVESSQTGVLIGIIAQCLLQTGLELPIRTFTNITNVHFDQDDDFLNQVWHQRYHFRNYRGSGDSDDQPMGYKEVLEQICHTYNLRIRQVKARWHVEQLPGLARGDAWQFDYDANGNQTGKNENPDLVTAIDQQQALLLARESRNRVTREVTRVVRQYNHKTAISGLSFDPLYTVDSEQNWQSEQTDVTFDSQIIVSLAGRVEVDIASPLSQPQTAAAILVVSAFSEAAEVFSQTLEILVGATSGTMLTKNFSRETGPIPASADELVISMRWASVPGHTVTEVRWKEMAGRFVAGDLISDSAALKFTLRRPEN